MGKWGNGLGPGALTPHPYQVILEQSEGSRPARERLSVVAASRRLPVSPWLTGPTFRRLAAETAAPRLSALPISFN